MADSAHYLMMARALSGFFSLDSGQEVYLIREIKRETMILEDARTGEKRGIPFNQHSLLRLTIAQNPRQPRPDLDNIPRDCYD